MRGSKIQGVKRIQIALVGDFNEKIHTLVALNHSIDHARPQLPFELQTTWIPTQRVEKLFSAWHVYHGIWIVPGSPYENDAGVFDVIRKAREENMPLLGTCGGFQYMILEYARNVLGIYQAAHQENNAGGDFIISKLNCSLKGEEERLMLQGDSWLYQVLKTDLMNAKYFCSYGINPEYYEMLKDDKIHFTAFSSHGDARAFELRGHPFFNGVLFQPSLESSMENPNPLLVDFFTRCSNFCPSGVE